MTTINYRTDNEITIRGKVVNIGKVDNHSGVTLTFLVHTEITHLGERYPKNFAIRLLPESATYIVGQSTQQPDVVEVIGSLHPDGSVVAKSFENLSISNRSSKFEVSSKNDTHIQGTIKSINMVDRCLQLTIESQYIHHGEKLATAIPVRIRTDGRLFSTAKMTNIGDLIRVRGPVHADNWIVPKTFENMSAYFDARNANFKSRRVGT
jgi:hypothetical protein